MLTGAERLPASAAPAWAGKRLMDDNEETMNAGSLRRLPPETRLLMST